jgi:hypothetical protein
MSYLSNNFDAFQEGVINGGYDPQEQDNHPVRAAGDWFRRHVGLLPVGNYKIHNPIGGRSSRSANKQTMLVPVEQPENVGYQGSFFTVNNFELRGIK